MSCAAIGYGLLGLFMLWCAYERGYENGCEETMEELEESGLLERSEP